MVKLEKNRFNELDKLMANKLEEQKFPTWILIAIIIGVYFTTGILVYIFKFSLTAGILTFVLLTILIGLGFLAHYLLVTLPKRNAEKRLIADTITPEESKNIALDYLLKEYGIVPREIILDTPKLIGDENKQLWHWLRIRDRIDDIKVDMFRNLTKVELRSIYFDLSKEQAERELTSLGIPLRERETFVKKYFDPYSGQLLRIEEGSSPKQFIEKTVELVKEQGTVEGSSAASASGEEE